MKFHVHESNDRMYFKASKYDDLVLKTSTCGNACLLYYIWTSKIFYIHVYSLHGNNKVYYI